MISPTTDLAIDKAASVPDLPSSRKRPVDESFEPNRKSQRVRYKSTPGGGSGHVAGTRVRKPQTSETDRQKHAYLQVGRYLLEQFSVPAFRSHATIGLVDRDRIQFYHANHSVILVSSAINFSASDRTGGLDKFIAIVIAFSRLSLRDNGILHNLHDGKLFRDNERLPTSKLAQGMVRMQEGNKLEFGGDGKTEPFTLTYGEVISHEPSLAGRSTAVLHAKSPKWKGVDLVVKISWPGSDRIPENEFLGEATKKAKSTGADSEWALNHLPQVLFAQDVVFDSDSTQEKVASLFDSAEFVNGDYEYERRTLRIIIQERLYPLKTLASVRDIAQVLVDVACSTWFSFTSWVPHTDAWLVHRWLYEVVGILHRDLSPNNIMYRIIKGKVHGVLTDYDLASWTASLTRDYAKTSQQRTGTPPFMAHGLLDGTDALHLYRHDVESLFYIMLILTTHYEFQAPEGEGRSGGIRVRKGKLRFRDWFEAPNYDTLGGIKSDFFTKMKAFEVSPSFKDFGGWLLNLQESLACGFQAKGQYDLQQRMRRRMEPEQAGDEIKSAAFDDETLGGYVTYSALARSVLHLTGTLKGLVIRYPPASTRTAQAGA